jgi:hypothetical protein
MKLRHIHFSVILLPHPDDAGRFVHFLATDNISELQMARRPGVTAPYFDWLLMRKKPDRFARPLWQHLGLEPRPPCRPGRTDQVPSQGPVQRDRPGPSHIIYSYDVRRLDDQGYLRAQRVGAGPPVDCM